MASLKCIPELPGTLVHIEKHVLKRLLETDQGLRDPKDFI
jgi:hypothetical protein